MKKIMIVIAAFVMVGSVWATPVSCIQKLTRNYVADSSAFTLNIEELDEQFQKNYGKDYLAQAILMIRALLDDIGCARSDINFSKGPFEKSRSICKHLVPGVDSSLMCYVETSLGFFNVSWDYSSRVHLIYSRWD